MERDKLPMAEPIYTAPYPMQPMGAGMYGTTNVINTTIPMIQEHDLEFHFMSGRRKVVLKQKFQWKESVARQFGICFEEANRYDVYDYHTGEAILHIKEKSGCLERSCCKPNHSAEFEFFNNQGGIVMRASKPFRFGCFAACCDPCKAQMILVSAVTGEEISKSKQAFTITTPTIETMDRNGIKVGKITGPTCCVSGLIELCSDIHFDVKHGDSKLGGIRKLEPSGLSARLQEVVGDSDTFVLDIPQIVDDEQAATYITSALLLDYLFFESGSPIECNSRENGGCSVNVCNCYCCGMVCPCQCQCGGKDDNNYS